MSGGPNDPIDVAVIGGGLAGGVAAFHLARTGLKTVIFEKERGPHHKVCGEFVSGEGIPILEELGISVKELGAVPIERLRVHGPRRSIEAKLPIPAVGLSRYVLDEAVLKRAEEAGAELRRGRLVREMVEGIENSPSGCVVLNTADGLVHSRRLVLATGKYEFKTVHDRVGRDSGYVGFKMHVKLKPSIAREMEGRCDLFVFEHGYGGLAPIEEGLANFCFLIERSVLRELGSDWDTLAGAISKSNWRASHALDGAVPQFRRFVTIANIPYGFVRSAKAEPGVYCVGDQMAVIPSLTGDGMSIAMMTGKRAADSIIDRRYPGRLQEPQTSSVYQDEMARFLRPQVETGFHLHRLFKHPFLCDSFAFAGSRFPALIERLFMRTRCRIEAALPEVQS